jgi:hypothetical protein
MIPKSMPLDLIRGWKPVSRLREALPPRFHTVDASAGEARSKKIILKQQAKAK